MSPVMRQLRSKSHEHLRNATRKCVLRQRELVHRKPCKSSIVSSTILSYCHECAPLVRLQRSVALESYSCSRVGVHLLPVSHSTTCKPRNVATYLPLATRHLHGHETACVCYSLLGASLGCLLLLLRLNLKRTSSQSSIPRKI